MEHPFGFNPQLEQEKRKTLKWSTAQSLDNVFNGLMLEIKDKYQLKPDDPRTMDAVTGMTRAVNDLEYFANSDYVAGQFTGKDSKRPEFEEHENESELVKQVREMSRLKLIARFEDLVQENKNDGNSTEKLQQMVDATKVVENFIRLTGRERTGELINQMTSERLKQLTENSDPGIMLYNLYNFDAWHNQVDKPKERENEVDSAWEVRDIVFDHLTRAFDEGLKIISEKYGTGE